MAIMFDLTELTGKQIENERRMVAFGQDVKRRYVKIGALALIPALLAIGLFMALGLGLSSVIAGLVVWPIPFLLVEGREQSGMHLTYGARGYDRLRTKSGCFMVCGRIIDPSEVKTRIVRSACVPVDREVKVLRPQSQTERMGAFLPAPAPQASTGQQTSRLRTVVTHLTRLRALQRRSARAATPIDDDL